MLWLKGQTYGQDLRDRVLQATGRGCEIAVRFDVSQRLLRVARTGSSHATRTEHPRCAMQSCPAASGPLKAEVPAQVAKAPEQTLVELCHWV